MSATSPGSSDVLIRFSLKTPYWPLSFSYGLFADPSTRTYFASLDHYIGYRMLSQYHHRERVMGAPNGYIAYQNLQAILQNSTEAEGAPIIIPTWEQERESILDEGLRLKYGQSTFMSDLLLRTGDRKIYDVSRDNEPYFCHCNGEGKNAHGLALMRLRDRIKAGGTFMSHT